MEESINENEDVKSEEKIDKEEEEIKKKRILKDGIKTLIGTEIRRFTFGSLMTLQSLNPYIISYLRHCQDEKTLTLQYGYFFLSSQTWYLRTQILLFLYIFIYLT